MIADGYVFSRQDPVGADVEQRKQNERTFKYARVGQLQIGKAKSQIVAVEEVEVDRARGMESMIARATEIALDALKFC